jgi:iron complex outermembrane recepter protein
VVVGAVRGDRLPFTPRYAASLNADYQWRLGGDVTASVGGSLRTLSRQSGSYDPAYLAAFGRFPDVRAYQLVDLRAGLSFGRYAINAYVNNLTDSGGIIATQPLLGVAGLPREVNGAIGTGIVRPRTIGVNLTVGF